MGSAYRPDRPDTEAGTRDGIGLQLIRGFSRQLGATLSVVGRGWHVLRRSPDAGEEPAAGMRWTDLSAGAARMPHEHDMR